MKKLVLGLLLTVGISGVSFANDVNKKDIYQIVIEDEILNENKNEIENDIFILSCTHAHYMNITDCSGETHSLYLGSYEGGCGGNEDGSIIMHVSRHNIEEISDTGCL